jgi:hypothetical protein
MALLVCTLVILIYTQHHNKFYYDTVGMYSGDTYIYITSQQILLLVGTLVMHMYILNPTTKKLSSSQLERTQIDQAARTKLSKSRTIYICTSFLIVSFISVDYINTKAHNKLKGSFPIFSFS